MNLDENFLQEVGLGEMPEGEKQVFLRHARAELETRVGKKMSEGLSREQLKEFEALMDGDQRAIKQMVLAMTADFREDKLYLKLLEKHGVTEGNWEILAEYLQVKWIKKNRPDYREIVNQALEELKGEIREHREEILG